MTAKKLTFSFNMSLDSIDRGVEVLQKRDKKTDNDWHMLACSVLRNWATSGAVNVAAEKATMIVNGAAYRNQALTDWFTVHAGFEWDATSKAFKYTRTKLEHDDVTAEDAFQSAKGEPFWKLSPPRVVKAFDLDTEIQKLIDKAKQRVKAAEDKDEKKYSAEDKISIDRVKALEAALGS